MTTTWEDVEAQEKFDSEEGVERFLREMREEEETVKRTLLVVAKRALELDVLIFTTSELEKVVRELEEEA